jgi:hypothetical protein
MLSQSDVTMNLIKAPRRDMGKKRWGIRRSRGKIHEGEVDKLVSLLVILRCPT